VDNQEYGMVRWVCNEIAEQREVSIYMDRPMVLRTWVRLSLRWRAGESPEYIYRGA
jgi:hypothetical protein